MRQLRTIFRWRIAILPMNCTSLQSIFLEYDNEKYETYRVDITFKENGIITDITVDAMGLQYHDFRSDNYAECYPNYEYIEEALQDAVEM